MNVILVPALRDNYIILLEEGSRAVVVDPGEAMPVLSILRKKRIKLDMILNTHHHRDHIGGNQALKYETGAEIIGP